MAAAGLAAVEGRPAPRAAVGSSSPDDRQHALDDLVDRHRRRVDVDRVRRQRERRDGARRVGLCRAPRSLRRPPPAPPGCRCAPCRWRAGARAPRPTRRGRSSRRRSGKTTVPMSRPSITTPPPRAQLALPRDEHLAHLRQPRHRARDLVDLRRADRARDVVAVDRRRRRLRRRCRRAAPARPPPPRRRAAMPVVQRLPADGAIHRAGVDVAVAECLGDRAGDGALAGPGRTVDGDDRSSS